MRLGNIAWMESAPDLPDATEAGGEETRRERVLVLMSELSAPVRGATITRTATGETWTITAVRARRNAAWELTVERNLSTEKTRGKYQ